MKIAMKVFFFVWEKYKTDLAYNDVKKKTLLNLFENEDALYNIKFENIDDEIISLLCPRNEITANTPDDKIKKLKKIDKDIQNIIWEIVPLYLPNFYWELKYYYPYLTALFRLQCLRIIYHSRTIINYSIKEEKYIHIGSGYRSIYKKANFGNKEKHVFFGFVFLKEDIVKFYIDKINDTYSEYNLLKVHLERYAFEQLKIIKSNQSNKRNLSFEIKSYLLSQLHNKNISNKNNLEENFTLLNYIIETIDKLRNNTYLNSNFISAEWRRLIQTLIFHYKNFVKCNIYGWCNLCEFNDEKNKYKKEQQQQLKKELESFKQSWLFKNIYTKKDNKYNELKNDEEKQISKQLPEEKKNIELIILFPLSPKEIKNKYLSIQFEIDSKLKIVCNKDNNNLKFVDRESKRSNENHKTIEVLCLDNTDIPENSQENVNKIAKFFKERIKSQLREFRNDFNSHEHYSEWLFFDRNRHVMQHMPFKEIRKRCSYATRASVFLTLADKGSYFKYNGLKNSLELTSETQIYNTVIDDEKKKRYENNLKIELEKWSCDITLRKKSSAYRCIDTPKIISRFVEENNVDPPFAEKIEDNRINSIWVKDDPIEEVNDILALPVMFHGRKQGVLHLESKFKGFFSIENRLKLFVFKRLFEEELFEARLNDTLNDINIFINEAISNKIDEFTFVSSVMEKIAILLGANGCFLSWCSHPGSSEFEVIGIAGERLKKILTRKSKINKKNKFIKKVVENKRINVNYYSRENIYQKDVFIDTIRTAGFYHCINVPLKDENDDIIIGIMSILDFEKNLVENENKMRFLNDSETLFDELVFLGNEVLQYIKHFFEHKRQIEFLMTIFAHDLDNFMLMIYKAADRLKYLRSKIDDKIDRINFERRINDIQVNALSSHTLFNFLSSNKLQEMNLSETPPLIIYRNFILKNTNFKDFNIREAILTTLNDYNKNFRKRNIKYFFDSVNLWLKMDFYSFNHVFDNLINNIIKYSKASTTVNVYLEQDKLGYYLVLQNTGYALDEEKSTDPEKIFKQGERGSSKLDVDGEGLGMYIAREFAKSWGGDILLEYKPLDDKWALFTFKVIFPLWLGKNFKEK